MQKYKREYLRAILRQDVAWYDTSNPEELSTVFAEAMVKVQKGLKATMPMCEGLGYGFGSLVVCFVPSIGNPEVAGITFATVPLLIVPALLMMNVMENGGKVVDKAYAQAGGIATECLFSMRTVASLGVEEKFASRYQKSLNKVRSTTIRNATAFNGFAGMALSAYLIMMAAGVVYGGYRLAGELEDSRFPYTFVDPVTSTTMHVCADGSVSTEACTTPFYMSCQAADAISDSESLLNSLGYASAAAFEASIQTLAQQEVPGYTSTKESYVECAIRRRTS